MLPDRRFSQNFLIDETILNKTISVAKINPSDLVIEIGPGTGNLTQKLLEANATVFAIEKDRRAQKFLEKLNCDNFSYEIIDVLSFDFSQFDRFKIVANLPYHITQEILFLFCNLREQIEFATIMIQREVAEKLNRGKINSLFVLKMQLFWEMNYEFTVSRSCFSPEPKVDSAVLTMSPTVLPASQIKEILTISKLSFQKKRKKLTSSLSENFSKEETLSALKKLNLKEDVRAEELTKDHWIHLLFLLTKT